MGSGGRLLTVNETAERLGVKACTIRAWILRRKHLPFVRLGRSVRFAPEVVEAFIERNTIPAREPRQ
jgi:excisionase family DNA binding protein